MIEKEPIQYINENGNSQDSWLLGANPTQYETPGEGVCRYRKIGRAVRYRAGWNNFFILKVENYA